MRLAEEAVIQCGMRYLTLPAKVQTGGLGLLAAGAQLSDRGGSRGSDTTDLQDMGLKLRARRQASTCPARVTSDPG